MFDVFCCSGVYGVLWIVLVERFTGFDVGEWSMLNWTLGFGKFLFLLGWIICLFISTVFWFWLWCLALLRSCWRVEYVLCIRSYCGSHKGAWQITGSSGSDNRACLSSSVYGLSWKEMHVDVWGFFCVFVAVVGVSWDVVGGYWCGGCWWILATQRKEHLKKWFLHWNIFSFFEAKFKCGRIIYWFFDKWVGFRQFLRRESLEGS